MAPRVRRGISAIRDGPKSTRYAPSAELEFRRLTTLHKTKVLRAWKRSLYRPPSSFSPGVAIADPKSLGNEDPSRSGWLDIERLRATCAPRRSRGGIIANPSSILTSPRRSGSLRPAPRNSTENMASQSISFTKQLLNPNDVRSAKFVSGCSKVGPRTPLPQPHPRSTSHPAPPPSTAALTSSALTTRIG